MTQPDGLFPDLAANFESLSAWSQITAEEWQESLTDGLEGHWTVFGAIAGPIIETIEDILEFLDDFPWGLG